MSLPSAKKDIRDAIVQVLQADVTLTGSGGGQLGSTVYAQYPKDQATFPYNVVKAISEVDGATAFGGRRGKDVTIEVHSWHDDRRGDKASSIDNRINELIDDETFTIDNWGFITSDFINGVTVQDERWAHIVSRFLVRVCS